jgi:SP family myo-inositol transporter-like MFS transporter 13
VPETKGLQFEEVEQMLGSKDYRAWKKFNPKGQVIALSHS